MASVKLEFAQFGNFTSFDILRSLTPMSVSSLPSPIVTGLTKMFYEDYAVVEGTRYYYRVVTHFGAESYVSDEISLVAVEDLLADYVVAHLPLRGDLQDLKNNMWSIIGDPQFYSLTPEGLLMFEPGIGPLCLYNSSNTLFNMGTGDYCIEAYMRVDKNKNFAIASFPGAWRPGCSAIGLEGMQTRHVIYGPPVIKGGSFFPLATMQHIAFTRQAGMFRAFFNGVKAYEASYPTAANFSFEATVMFGWMEPGQSLEGLVRDVRVTKGNARYTSNFTPSSY